MLSLLLALHAAHAEPLPACELSEGAWLLTMSPGTDVQTIFGHTAVLLYDPGQGEFSPVYDYGRFDVEALPKMAWEVLTMTKPYYVASRQLAEVRATYDRKGRGVTAQRLDLSPAQLGTFSGALTTDLNADLVFPYNWYRPNCTTMVLDRIDDAVGGRVKAELSGLSGISPAGEVLRHSGDHLPLWLGLRWGSGAFAHRPVDHYSASFLPDRLASSLEQVRHPGGRPLVGPRCQLASVAPATVPAEGPQRHPLMIFLGALWASVLVGTARAHRGAGRALVALHGLAVGLWGSAALLVGSLGTFAPFWGHHNLTVASPLTLGLIGAAWWSPRTEGRGPQAIAAALAALALVGLGTALLGNHNLGLVLGLGLPLGAMVWALRPAP